MANKELRVEGVLIAVEIAPRKEFLPAAKVKFGSRPSRNLRAQSAGGLYDTKEPRVTVL
jgi:hypothetical protein